MTWWVYIVKCSDDSYYTGVTTDIDKRLQQHNSDNTRGSRYIRFRRPATLVHSEAMATKSQAFRKEVLIKGWSKQKKMTYIQKATCAK